ncbi:MAG: class I SAM-dependent methyltransferase [Alphaproteobacteria bacterium]|nr:MAG: class I SAM-dependent methyltransferase [Alphaproteobacteria bacterium]
MPLKAIVRRLPGYRQLRPLLRDDQSRITSAWLVVREIYMERGSGQTVLDLGCGEGTSLDWFLRLDPSVRWHGVDIEDSPEVRARAQADPRMSGFDGVHLPYGDASFDIVFCHQVYEHVRRPLDLIGEVRRVLKPGGIFVGSVAYLEPYHSYSLFNLTPYGMAYVMEHGGLAPQRLMHSSDAFYKIFRQLFGGARLWSVFWKFSPLYLLIHILGSLAGLDKQDINLLKIQYAGAFCFVGRRPDVP